MIILPTINDKTLKASNAFTTHARFAKEDKTALFMLMVGVGTAALNRSPHLPKDNPTFVLDDKVFAEELTRNPELHAACHLISKMLAHKSETMGKNMVKPDKTINGIVNDKPFSPAAQAEILTHSHSAFGFWIKEKLGQQRQRMAVIETGKHIVQRKPTGKKRVQDRQLGLLFPS